jgi:hypothetical protein
LVCFLVGCVGPAPRDLVDLISEDSTYVDPGTGLPYSGPVSSAFSSDPRKVEIEGELLNGEWDGELTVYHLNGRVRYMGSFVAGERCGPWTENADSVAPVNVYAELFSEIESMGIYPPCEPGNR